MKAFVFGYQTNYDLGAAIVYAKSLKRAKELAKKHNYVWDTNNVYEIDLNNNEKVIIIREDCFWDN
mgnify:FL=1